VLDFKIVIPYRDNPTCLSKCLESIPKDIKVIVVDDCSSLVPDVNEYKNVSYRRLQKRGYFAGAVNAGIVAAQTDVLILNQDIVLKKGWLNEVVRQQNLYDLFGDGVMNHPAWLNGYVQGTFMYISKRAVDKVGLLNEKHWPLWGGTCEYQLRVCRAGLKANPFAANGELFEHSRVGSYGSAIEEELKQNSAKHNWLIRTPPLVSVVAPCFNHGRYAKDLLDSLMAQTFQGFDLTIVDDKSKDDTWQNLQQITTGMKKITSNHYEDAWNGIRVIQLSKNAGTAAATNAGIKACRGRFILTIDGDDMLAPNAIERFLVELEKDDSVLAYSDAELWRDGAAFDYWKFKPYDFDELIKKNFISSCTMFSRQSWEKVGGYPEQFRFGRQDWAWAVAMGRSGFCGVWVSEPLLRYRREGQNRVTRNSTHEWRDFFLTQMTEAFPDVYGKGARPVACCGKRSSVRPVVKTSSGVIMPAMPSSGDMVMVEYIGTSEGRQTFSGRETGLRYVVGAGKKYTYVDKLDLDQLLSTRVAHKPIFKLYVKPEPIQAPLIVEEEVEKVAVQMTLDDALEAVSKAEPEPVVEVEVEKPKRRRKVANA
jgi:glycosyltransferase involved in cell wall biosynthesis